MKRHLCLSILLLALSSMYGSTLPYIGHCSEANSFIKTSFPTEPNLIILRTLPALGSAELRWDLKDQSNIKSCYVERSINGDPFELIAGVCMSAVSSEEGLHLADKLTPKKNARYFDYRIEVVLNDGSKYYTKVQRVYPFSAKLLKVHPAPKGVMVFLEDQPSSPHLQLEVYSILGRKVLKKNFEYLSSHNPAWIDLPNLKKGLYIFKLSDGLSHWFGRFQL